MTNTAFVGKRRRVDCDITDLWQEPVRLVLRRGGRLDGERRSGIVRSLPLQRRGATQCSGDDCTNVYDKDGCDFNSWRMVRKDSSVRSENLAIWHIYICFDTQGNRTYLGPWQVMVNTEIYRLYIQNGKVIQNSQSTILGV
jgi:hypothetical protein